MERTGRPGRSRAQPVGRRSVGEAKLGGEGGGDVFRLVPERVSVRGAPAGYPAEWPAVSWIVRAQADFRLAHCGRRYPPGGLGEDALGVHHLDGDRFNLWDWNLVPLCLVDHGLVEREIHVDRDQLAMFGSGFPWLGPRVAARVAAIEAGLWSPGNRRRGAGRGDHG